MFASFLVDINPPDYLFFEHFFSKNTNLPIKLNKSNIKERNHFYSARMRLNDLQPCTVTTSLFSWEEYVTDIFNCPEPVAAHGRASVPIRSNILVFRIFKVSTEPSVSVRVYRHFFSFVFCSHLEFSSQQDLTVS